MLGSNVAAADMTGLRSSAVLNVVHVTGRPPKANNNFVSASYAC
jgi:hypothetical protein